jgi:hypothetical protein
MEVDVALFGSPRVAHRLDHVHDALANGTALPANFTIQVKELLTAARGVSSAGPGAPATLVQVTVASR